MEKFQILKPCPALAPYVKYYWFLETDGMNDAVQRITPTGSIDLVFHRGSQMFSLTDSSNQSSSFLSGQSSGFIDMIQTGKVDMISITFKPQGARSFFKIPMNEFNNKNIALDMLSDKELKELEDKLMYTTDNLQCVSIIENFLIKRIYTSNEYNYPKMNAVVNAINNGETDIKALSELSFLSYKQFQRIFSEYIGSNPKEFLRVVRFQKALYYLQYNPNINLAQLAVECDCYDQSHLIKEFKIFSGYTPKEYMAECLPFSDYFFMA